VAKPQPAAAEALEDLASELDVAVVPLRSLSQRELSQNTGLPESDAEHMRMRDFDELFFFAGATDPRYLRILPTATGPQSWASLVSWRRLRCIRELGAHPTIGAELALHFACGLSDQTAGNLAQRWPGWQNSHIWIRRAGEKNSSSKSRMRMCSASLSGSPVFWLNSRCDKLRNGTTATSSSDARSSSASAAAGCVWPPEYT